MSSCFHILFFFICIKNKMFNLALLSLICVGMKSFHLSGLFPQFQLKLPPCRRHSGSEAFIDNMATGLVDKGLEIVRFPQ